MGCKQVKIHAVTPIDIRPSNGVELFVSERIIAETNTSQNDKAADDIVEEFQSEKPNKVDEKDAPLDEPTCERADKINDEHFVLDEFRSYRSVAVNTKHVPFDESKAKSEGSDNEQEDQFSLTEFGNGRSDEVNKAHVPFNQFKAESEFESESKRSNKVDEKHFSLDESKSEFEVSDKVSGEQVSINVLRDFGSAEVNAEHMSLGKSESERSNEVNEECMALEVVPVDIDLTSVDNHAFTAVVCQQRQAAIDNMFYQRAIDQWQPKSIEQLIDSIKKLSANKNEMDQAWIIFYWISKNIRYDTKAYFNNNITSQASKNVFLSRKAVCEGYSTLHSYLCIRTGLQCRKVSGYAKGYSFNLRQTNFEKTNHAWNILLLSNEHSYFVESTWGSGHLDDSTHQYRAKLVPFYFLCRPEHMIYGHLPENPQWQLLAYPLTMKQYLMLPCTHEQFFELNLNIVSPVYTHEATLKTGEMYGEVLIGIPANDVELSGSLRDESNTKIEGGDIVYFDRDQNLWRCRFAPQKAGKHTILIYGHKKSDAKTSTLSCTVQFTFDIDHLPAPPISYPLTWSHFFDYRLEIIKPINCRYIEWPSDKNLPYCEILVRSPNDTCLSATMADRLSDKHIENGSLVNFDIKAALWQCLFAPSTTGVSYKLTLFARRLDENQSHCVAQFDLQRVHKKILENCIIFPSTFSTFHEANCHLFEPLNGVLRRGSTIRFHCRIPGACEVNITIDGQWLKEDSSSYLDDNDTFKREIQVGQKEVAVWVKSDKERSHYTGLLKYSVK